MSQESKSIRVRTTPGGTDKFVKVELNQTFDTLDILSLKIDSDKIYRSFCSDYGVVIGRVLANDGFGVENVKISAFIPISEDDKQDPVKRFLYPYEQVTDRNTQGVRYNLLPKGGRFIKIFKETDCVPIPQAPTFAPNGLTRTSFTSHVNSSGIFVLYPAGSPLQDFDWVQASDFGVNPTYIVDNSNNPLNGNNSNCDGTTGPNDPATTNVNSSFGTKKVTDMSGTRDLFSDGFFETIRQNDLSQLKIATSKTSFPSNILPELDGDNTGIYPFISRQIWKEQWNKGAYQAPPLKSLWTARGFENVTYTNVSNTSSTTWTIPSNTNLPANNINSILLFGSSIFAGTSSSGVYLSNNVGGTWTQVSNGLSGTALQINDIKVSSDTKTLYTATNGGVYKSTDAGANWTFLNQFQFPVQANTIAISGNSNVVFAGSDYPGLFKGVYRSTAGGNNWVNMSFAGNDDYNQIIVSKLLGNNIVYGATSGGFRISTDGGVNWTLSNTGLNGSFLNLSTVEEISGGTLNNSVFVASSNGGGVARRLNGFGATTWTYHNNGLTGSALNVHKIFYDGSAMYIATDDGVYKSTNPLSTSFSGVQWNKIGGTSLNQQVYDVFVNVNVFVGTLSTDKFAFLGDSYTIKVISDKYVLTDCKYIPKPPDNITNQQTSWSQESSTCDPKLGGKTLWSCIVDLGFSNGPQTPVGTFPADFDLSSDEDTLFIYDKYYKYTTRTNTAGDYMIFGVPVGQQIIHMDLDLSDIGSLSFTADELISQGTPASQFNGNNFKYSADLDSLPQIISQNAAVNVIPFWGDLEICEVGITRCDFKFNLSSVPTAVFFFAYGFDNNTFGAGKGLNWNGSGRDDGREGRWNLLSPYIGVTYDLSFIAFDNSFNVVSPQKTPSIKVGFGDGGIVATIPMFDDNVITDEFGNQVLSNDVNKGIPSTARYRIDFHANGSLDLRNPANYDNIQGPQNFKFEANRAYSIKSQMINSGVNLGLLASNDFNGDPGLDQPILNSNIINGFLYLPRIDYTNKPNFVTLIGGSDPSFTLYDRSALNVSVIDVTSYIKNVANDTTFTSVLNYTNIPGFSPTIDSFTPQDSNNGGGNEVIQQSPGTSVGAKFRVARGLTAGRNVWKQALNFFKG